MREAEVVSQKCVFCAIAEGSAFSRMVFQTDDLVCFFPLKPEVLGHTLIAPRQHVEHLAVQVRAREDERARGGQQDDEEPPQQSRAVRDEVRDAAESAGGVRPRVLAVPGSHTVNRGAGPQIVAAVAEFVS